VSEFAYLFRGGKRATSPEAWQKQSQKWIVWTKELGAQGSLKERGNPLEPAGQVVGAGGQRVSDAPAVGSADLVVGYMVVEARDLEHAVELASGCPIFETGGLVEVRPVTKMEGSQ